MKKIGIYKIKNIITGKFYIGSSLEIKQRWQRHLKDLENNKHHSIILQRAWNKYGKENFIFEILEECSIENLLILEQEYLDNYLPVYNICPNAGNSYGRKDSIETKMKKRKIALELGLKPPVPIKVPVQAIADDGKIIDFDSVSSACFFVGKPISFASSISRAIKKNIKAYNYKWKYKEL